MFTHTSYEVLTETKIRIVIFMVMLSWPSCNLLAGYRCFGKYTASISALKMGAICYPETSGLTYQSIYPHNSEDHNINSYFPVEFTSCSYSKTCLQCNPKEPGCFSVSNRFTFARGSYRYIQ
jgi:hypothetical protein